MTQNTEPEEYHPTCGMRVTAAAEEAVRRVLLSQRPLVMVVNGTRIKVDLGTSAVAICAEYHAADQSRTTSQSEPVCPEGVTVRRESVYIYVDRAGHVRADGSVSVVGSTCADRVALRYLVDLADHRARIAGGARERALAEAQAEYDKARQAWGDAQRAEHAAGHAFDKAKDALERARREAGL